MGDAMAMQHLTAVRGRVLEGIVSIPAIGDTLEAARAKAYHAVSAIQFEGKIFRKDIGAKALAISGRSL